MITLDARTSVLSRLEDLQRLCPDMRLGQILATIGLLGEDTTGRSLWEIEDDELSAAVERFSADLARRTSEPTP